MPKFYIYLLMMSILVLTVGCSYQNTNINSQSLSPVAINQENRYTINIPPQAGDIPSLTFETTTPFPKFSDQIQVYKMVKPDITVEYVANIGSKLGLTGEVKRGDGAVIRGLNLHKMDN